MAWRSLALGLISLVGCGDPLDLPPSQEVALEITPSAEGRALPVARISAAYPGASSAVASELFLFRGPLSDYDLGRIRRRDLPKTLSARLVRGLTFFRVAKQAVTFAPVEPLELGASYTLATPSAGVLGEVEVTEGPTLPILERVWPPKGLEGGRILVFCGAGVPDRAQVIGLDPTGLRAELRPGVGDGAVLERDCATATLDAPDPSGLAVPQPAIAGALLDPAELHLDARDDQLELECADGQQRFGPGCATILDDRMLVKNPDQTLLWLIKAPGGASLVTVPPGAELLIRGLMPDRAQPVTGLVVTPAGVEQRLDYEVVTAPARPRLLINEVMANPLGAEPAQEWVEVLNAGAAAIDLGGMRLEDSGGAVELSPFRLEAGQYALLVGAGYLADGGFDVAPVPGTALVTLSELGHNGLTNAGEPLLIRGATGDVVSRFPPVAARRAGFSIARTSPDASEDDPDAFAEHAPPGASPGGPNLFDR